MTTEEMQFKYMGKTVRVIRATRKGGTVVGPCMYIGPNEHINWPLQITVGRTPIKLRDLSQITLEEEYQKKIAEQLS